MTCVHVRVQFSQLRILNRTPARLVTVTFRRVISPTHFWTVPPLAGTEMIFCQARHLPKVAILKFHSQLSIAGQKNHIQRIKKPLSRFKELLIRTKSLTTNLRVTKPQTQSFVQENRESIKF